MCWVQVEGCKWKHGSRLPREPKYKTHKYEDQKSKYSGDDFKFIMKDIENKGPSASYLEYDERPVKIEYQDRISCRRVERENEVRIRKNYGNKKREEKDDTGNSKNGGSDVVAALCGVRKRLI